MRKNPVTRYFDRWAARFDADMTHYAYAEPVAVREALAPFLPPEGNFKLLDVGVGTGLSCLPFRAAYLQNAHITGVDASASMLAACARKGVANVLAQSDIAASDLPFSDNVFDCVIALGVIEYVSDPTLFFERIARVLKPHGVCAVTFETPATKHMYRGIFDGVVKDTGHQVTIQRLMPRCFIPRLYRKYLYTPEAAVQGALNEGLDIVSETGFTSYAWTKDAPIYHGLIIARKRPTA